MLVVVVALVQMFEQTLQDQQMIAYAALQWSIDSPVRRVLVQV